MKKSMTIELTIAAILVLWISAFAGSRPALAQARTPPRDLVTYEDKYTFKHGSPFTYDPWVWVYTREFAERFAMPEKWIDQSLKGALAIAFRMSTIRPTICGLAGNEQSCWPPLVCQLDVYTGSEAPIPWVRPEIVRDSFMRGIASEEYLKDLNDDKRIRRYVPKNPGDPDGVLGWTMFITRSSGRSGNIERSVAYFDREYQRNTVLIGFSDEAGPCPSAVGVGELTFYDLETTERIRTRGLGVLQSAKPTHIIEIPRQFMERANSVYVKTRQEKEEAARRLYQDMQKRQGR